MSFLLFGNKGVKPRRALRSPAYLVATKLGPPFAYAMVLAALLFALVVGNTWVAAEGAQSVVSSSVSAPAVSEKTPDEAATSTSSEAPNSNIPIPSVAKVDVSIKPKVSKRSESFKPIVYSISGTRYACASVRVRKGPGTSFKVVKTLNTGDKIKVTRHLENGWREVSIGGNRNWVINQCLLKSKPAPPKPKAKSSNGASRKPSGSVSGARCASGSAVEAGLVPNAIKVHRALCSRFPGIYAYGGRRASSGFHGTGQALDAMVRSNSYGWEVAYWVRANSKSLGVSEVIFAQKIWTRQRSGEGWRWMEDRGNATANHYDHVHVSVY